ncbi:MAG TPA: hypothetical protein VIV60_05910 [Polyangiaceae bacterium]
MAKSRYIVAISFILGGLVTGSAMLLLVPRVGAHPLRLKRDEMGVEPVRHDAESNRESPEQWSERTLASDRLAQARPTTFPASVPESEASPPADTAPERVDFIASASDVLDERMLTAPVDGRSSGEMSRAVQSMIVSSGVRESEVVSTHCGSTMCKIIFRGENDKELEKSSRALSESTPKLFGGAAAYPSGAHEKAFYLAKNGATLNVEPTDEGRPDSTQRSVDWTAR